MSEFAGERAVAYVRVSGKGQLEKYGPDRQDEVINDWANAAGVIVDKQFVEAITGKYDDSKRTRFKAMCEYMMANGIRLIIVESLDRFARDLMVQSVLLASLKVHGFTLISAITGDDVTAAMDGDPMRRAMCQVIGVFSELDKNMIVRRLKKGRDAKRKATGRCEGRKPFGLSPKHPEEAPVLELARQLRKGDGKKKLPLYKVAEELNARGHRTRAGALWCGSKLSSLFKSLAGIPKSHRNKRPNRTAPSTFSHAAVRQGAGQHGDAGVIGGHQSEGSDRQVIADVVADGVLHPENS